MLIIENNPDKKIRSFELHTYTANRIASKLMRLLKKDGVYKVGNDWDPERTDAERIYTISIETDREYRDVIADLKNEIISYLPDHFPKNYTFEVHLFDKFPPLGFIYSFEIVDELTKGVLIRGSHRIKEIKKS